MHCCDDRHKTKSETATDQRPQFPLELLDLPSLYILSDPATATTTMSATNDAKIKQLVQAKYGEIAEKAVPASSSSCCSQRTSASCCSSQVFDDMGVSRIMADEYKDMDGYNPDADLGLGCGLPTKFAHIQQGDHVLDLGSGAGNDCFVARSLTGPTGKVVGVDFTPAMIERARANAARRGFTNVTFVQGDIESLPFDNNTFHVIVSNCVLNLVPNKAAVFQEMMRVLRPGGHFSVSDIVLQGHLSPAIRSAAECKI